MGFPFVKILGLNKGDVVVKELFQNVPHHDVKAGFELVLRFPWEQIKGSEDNVHRLGKLALLDVVICQTHGIVGPFRRLKVRHFQKINYLSLTGIVVYLKGNSAPLSSSIFITMFGIRLCQVETRESVEILCFLDVEPTLVEESKHVRNGFPLRHVAFVYPKFRACQEISFR